MHDEIKRLVADHCGPVLLGCKPAAMFTLPSESALALLGGLLWPRLGLLVLRKNGNGLVALVFEEERLLKTLLAPDSLALLGRLGYPREAPLCAFLDRLRRRFAREDFPHEVGLFLGYPAEDVLGFMRHRGRNYKYSGYWKVYGDVELAKRCFRRYDACRDYFKKFLPPPGFFRRGAEAGEKIRERGGV